MRPTEELKKEHEAIKLMLRILEKEIIGPGRHEEFHKLLHHLKEIYL